MGLSASPERNELGRLSHRSIMYSVCIRHDRQWSPAHLASSYEEESKKIHPSMERMAPAAVRRSKKCSVK